jgi:hypothetical protein
MHEKRPSIMQEHPSLTPLELVKLIGAMWVALSPQERLVYQQRIQTLDTEASTAARPVNPPANTEASPNTRPVSPPANAETSASTPAKEITDL